MEQTQSNSSTEEPADLGSEFQVQLDHFRKLGFSQMQVKAVLLKLGLQTDTNRVLEELIQAGAETEDREDLLASPELVPRGEGITNTNSSVTTSNISVFLPTEQEDGPGDDNDLRPIVIDGSNVAMSHGNKEVFSCFGIQLAVKYFLDRGHTDITVFVPSWRREQPRPDVPITDQHILRELEKRKILVFTPSRRVAGKRVVCYDDRFIVKLAYEVDGIIVSNDTYRDLQGEKPEWKRFIEERLLMYSFVNDKFMPPDDPLGRHGPTLDNFLRKTQRAPKRVPCPYGKKCTYGFKCKFSHPERAKQSHRSLADELREKAKMGIPMNRQPPAGPASSQERLDSGLGSYDCHCMKLYGSNSDHVCGKEHRKSKAHPGGRHRNMQSIGSQPCSCCSLQSLGSSTGYQQHSMGLASSQNPGMMSYCQPQYHSYGGAPAYPAANMSQYSLPHDYHYSRMPPPQNGYWSKTYGGYSHPGPSQMQGESTTWGPAPAKSSTLIPEREQIRKKLRAVFNASLVDRAMGMFPNITDPQKLAIEILSLQSYEGVL